MARIALFLSILTAVVALLSGARSVVREWRQRRARRLWCLIVVSLVSGWLALSSPTEAYAANEARCTELGANCIASEPLNTNSYGYANPWCNPSDTTGSDKQMSLGGAAGNTIENSNGTDMGSTWSYPSSGALFTALPNISPSVNFVLQGTPEPSDVGFLGHIFNSGDPTARRSIRWYQYFSSTWELTNGSCLNRGKIFELGDQTGSMVFTSDGDHQIYGFTNWNIAPFDCCTGGPGSQSFAMNTATMGGKWWRFELIVRNALPTGGVTIVELWRRNITDNGTDTKVIDTADPTYGPGTGGDDWTSTQATTLKPNARVDEFVITPWGNGTCTGFVGYTHFLAAAWSTDSGQRIGAASEIEGGSPPASPRNIVVLRSMQMMELALPVLGLGWHVRRAILAGVMVVLSWTSIATILVHDAGTTQIKRVATKAALTYLRWTNKGSD